MKAGAAKLEITPPLGRLMAGFGSRTETAQGTHDPLFVRALVLEGSQGPVALVVADLISIPEHIQDAAASDILARIGIGREQLQLCGTHTHGGPAFTNPDDYAAWLAKRIADSVEEAWRSQREALAAVGTGTLTGIGKNRRRSEGPVDNDVTVLRIDDTAGRGIATLMNYSCHPTTLGPDNLYYTADYPGVACVAVDQASEGIAIFTTGAQGNVNPGGYSAEGSMIGQVVPWRNYASAEQYGTEVARVALETRSRLKPVPTDRVWGRGTVLELPRKALLTIEEATAAVTAADAVVDRVRQSGTTAQLHAAMIKQAYAEITKRQAVNPDRDRPVRLRLGTLGLGPATHVAISGELFVELGLQIKQALGQGTTFISVLSDGSNGYIPTREAFAEGGYEPAASVLQPGGGEAITEAAIAVGLGS